MTRAVQAGRRSEKDLKNNGDGSNRFKKKNKAGQNVYQRINDRQSLAGLASVASNLGLVQANLDAELVVIFGRVALPRV